MNPTPETVLLTGLGAVDTYAIAALDSSGTIMSWNSGAISLTGFSADEALGGTFAALLADGPDHLTPEHLSRLAATRSEGGVWLRRADRSYLWARVTVAEIPGERESFGFAVVFRDATALKIAREELERSKTMFEGILAIASDAVVCVDDTHRIIFFNDGAQRIFDYPPEDALGQPLDILIPERHRVGHSDRIREFALSPVSARQMGERGEISGRRRNGEIFSAEASISKLLIGDGMIYTAVLRDVTERRIAAEALAQKADELAQSNAELEQFAYVASHDLQEPLRMVASYTQLLARRYRGKLDEDADEFIGFAVDGVNRMQALINDLLAYSRVGTRGGDLGSASMEVALQRVLVSLSPTIEESRGQITHDPLPSVRGDAGQLAQLLQNLIQNSIKFQKAGQEPRVHIGVEDGGEVWHFSVRDNGIGIAPEFQERIFVIFQRLHNRVDYPGTGIGLAICKKIVESHHGRIWVESEVSDGSTFHFTLPKEQPE